MKTRLFLILAALSLSFPPQANALSDQELLAIDEVLTAEAGGQKDVEALPLDTLDQQQIEQNTEPEADNAPSPSSLEIFYRLGRIKEKEIPFSDPGKMERQARQRDQRIKELFGKEREHE
ncbi:hypothetical protein SAMN02746065_1455 [Desulfocicer vacuolatum DSM 3385]|uniref:Uncharacterized protein n=1 Tax=Desulfocicer vacuolatum DSM 3385 TaxID=1121400 RepID=A0A1W2ETJ5_9BACT|nr:hypothetical protein [Desulfocicer vacuolatum]SMD13040.1 hypothetical protein SAMN02746065_1455 [Desulfocicer vacuolatum DSM 3385]